MTPDWQCIVSGSEVNTSDWDTGPNSTTFKKCQVGGVKCQRYHFYGSSHTLVNEWNVLCDRAWIKQVVTSAQFAGVMVGSFVGGWMGDALGRKNSLYAFMALHALTNIVCAFSVCWEMFAALRCLIGVGCGGIMVITFPYMLEFLPRHNRAFLALLPFWALNLAIFAIAALILDHWAHVHLACGLISTPVLIGWFAVVSAVYYGISFGLNSLEGNIFLNLFLLGLIDVPFYIPAYFLTNK
ncbi:uncharacterized protein F23F12.3 [Aplysia californica]|uniref:Uncharacterized protein F23F12.3 n=1 Tax=Aplysia californica TaxID=6500 RepID=A0ABM1W100_APLCA|nr:uncharacterized protein F23F12.3 [Aplysia californica]